MKKIGSFFLAIMFYIVLFVFALHQLDYQFHFESLVRYKTLILKGWFYTIEISILSLIVSLVLGFIIYLMRNSKIQVISYLAKIYIEVMFGTPLLVIVIIGYYILGAAFQLNDPFLFGIILLSGYISSYIAEIYRAGIEVIPKEQWEAIKVYRFSKYDAYRSLIIPQMLRNILPPLASQLAMLIKSSALLSYMGTADFFNVMSQVQSNTFASIESYFILALGYLVLTIPLSLLIKDVELKLKEGSV